MIEMYVMCLSVSPCGASEKADVAKERRLMLFEVRICYEHSVIKNQSICYCIAQIWPANVFIA